MSRSCSRSGSECSAKAVSRSASGWPGAGWLPVWAEVEFSRSRTILGMSCITSSLPSSPFDCSQGRLHGIGRILFLTSTEVLGYYQSFLAAARTSCTTDLIRDAPRLLSSRTVARRCHFLLRERLGSRILRQPFANIHPKVTNIHLKRLFGLAAAHTAPTQAGQDVFA